MPLDVVTSAIKKKNESMKSFYRVELASSASERIMYEMFVKAQGLSSNRRPRQPQA